MINCRRPTALLSAAALLAFSAACAPVEKEPISETVYRRPAEVMNFTQSDAAIYNPLTGFAPEGDYEKSVGENTLVYIEVLWKDIEPEEGVYDFTGLEEQNHLDQWRAAGKHAVLRFMCDKPGREAHMDIPHWLYNKTGDGTHYT